MHAVAIVLISTIAAVVYGLAHDQITIRICPEYFTVFHPQVLPDRTSLTLLALAWGVIATWWVGAFLGIFLALAARVGRRPKMRASDLIGPIVRLMLTVGLLALIAGTVGYIAARKGWIVPSAPWKSRIPAALHARFLADLWAHNASYAIGFLGGLVLCARIWRKRGRRQEAAPATLAG